MATAGQMRLSRGRMEARLRMTGSLACSRARPISLARARLWGMEADWAVFQGMVPWGSSSSLGARDEVMTWTPEPLEVAWRMRQAAGWAWLAISARWSVVKRGTGSLSRVEMTVKPLAVRTARRV